jgi:hypothetical protein
MTGPKERAKELAAAWARRPSLRAAASLRGFYGKNARKLPLGIRAELCIALGEASELEGHFETARYLYASAVSAVDPDKDERLYTRAALRALLNASRLQDRSVLLGVATVVEQLGPEKVTPRLACVGAVARGLERFLEEDWTGARRAFEAAMGAAWESQDHDGEALAHHLLAQAWNRLGRLALAKEHVDAARAAAVKAHSWLLDRRLSLESIMFRLLARVNAEVITEARRLMRDIQRLGFPRFESMAWSRLARGVLPDRRYAETFITRSERLLPEGHPDRAMLKVLRASLAPQALNGPHPDKAVTRELAALARMARG